MGIFRADIHVRRPRPARLSILRNEESIMLTVNVDENEVLEQLLSPQDATKVARLLMEAAKTCIKQQRLQDDTKGVCYGAHWSLGEGVHGMVFNTPDGLVSVILRAMGSVASMGMSGDTASEAASVLSNSSTLKGD